MEEVFYMPRRIITDVNLSIAGRYILAVIYANQTAPNQCKKSLHELSELSNYSYGAVVKALQELSYKNYLRAIKAFYYHEKNIYHLNTLSNDELVQIPCSVMQTIREVKGATAIAFLYCIMLAEGKPYVQISIKEIKEALGIALSSVARVIKTLESSGLARIERSQSDINVYEKNKYWLNV